MYAQQPPAYGQVPYATQGYPQRVPPATYPQQQYPAASPAQYPPQPVCHVDPNTFRKEYNARLAELTVNSRPIIQGLSMMAQEYSRWAEIVGQCIEAHIRRVSRLKYFFVGGTGILGFELGDLSMWSMYIHSFALSQSESLVAMPAPVQTPTSPCFSPRCPGLLDVGDASAPRTALLTHHFLFWLSPSRRFRLG
jgi:hypothetical protein